MISWINIVFEAMLSTQCLTLRRSALYVDVVSSLAAEDSDGFVEQLRSDSLPPCRGVCFDDMNVTAFTEHLDHGESYDPSVLYCTETLVSLKRVLNDVLVAVETFAGFVAFFLKPTE